MGDELERARSVSRRMHDEVVKRIHSRTQEGELLRGKNHRTVGTMRDGRAKRKGSRAALPYSGWFPNCLSYVASV